MRKLEDQDVVGRTIAKIDALSVNMVKIQFEDGGSLELWAEQAVFTNAGNIPGIFVDNITYPDP